jgi:hypothetical protein
MSVVTGMTTEDEKKKEELKRQQEELSRELKKMKDKLPSVNIDKFAEFEEKAKRTRKDIRELEKL